MMHVALMQMPPHPSAAVRAVAALATVVLHIHVSRRLRDRKRHSSVDTRQCQATNRLGVVYLDVPGPELIWSLIQMNDRSYSWRYCDNNAA